MAYLATSRPQKLMPLCQSATLQNVTCNDISNYGLGGFRPNRKQTLCQIIELELQCSECDANGGVYHGLPLSVAFGIFWLQAMSAVKFNS